MSEDVDIILKENVWLNKLQELTPFEYKKQEDPMKNRYFFQGENVEPSDQIMSADENSGDGDEASEDEETRINKNFQTIVLGLF